MTDFKQIIKGQMFLFGGYFLILILSYILPPLISAGEGIFSSNTDIQGIIWIGAIFLYICAGVVVPLMMIYKGLTTEIPNSNPLGTIVISIIATLLGFLLTIKGWFMITAFASIANDGFTLALFWIGFALSWIGCLVITPIYVITKESQRF